VLLLLAPIRRAADGEIERVQARAYWLDLNLLDLGKAMGTLFQRTEIGPRFHIDHLGTTLGIVADAWRSLKLDPFNVHVVADRVSARRISGTQEMGPFGVLAGGGALGGAMLDLWRRAGWGEWAVIDPDHLKPHNIIRHASPLVGQPKVDALAIEDMQRWREHRSSIQAIVGDAGNFEDPAVLGPLHRASLIVDATTSVDVPRRLGKADLRARVVSVFLTPSGSASVLIAEDIARDRRIDALEAQYWRAVLNEEWGREHVAAPVSTFRSGTSCSDVSLVMAYSTILAHAATLSEQIQTLPPAALIRIWQRDRALGTMVAHDVPIAEPLVANSPDLRIVWDGSTLQKVRALRAAALPAETGGVLIGYYDLNEQRIYVVDALEAPPDSIGTPQSFERGINGLATRFGEITRRSAGQISYLGEWHSHPRGYRANESPDDIWQLLYLGELLRRDGLPALMFIVAEEDHQWLIAR
jgi:integrative and conjugative element protein (TIGR02256 family)